MTKERKYTWQIIYASIHIHPDIWSNAPHSRFTGTKTEVQEHVQELNETIHPGARNKIRFTYLKMRNKKNERSV